MRGSENALQGKYGGYRGISGITSRRKIDGRDFLLVICESGYFHFWRDVHFRISLRETLFALYRKKLPVATAL